MSAERLRARRLAPDDRPAALAYLRAARDLNLVLIDQVERLVEPPQANESPPQIHGAFVGNRLTGIASLRPSIALSAGIDDEALGLLRPALLRVPTGLLKGERRVVDRVFPWLAASGCEALIDRVEIAYRLRPGNSRATADPEKPDSEPADARRDGNRPAGAPPGRARAALPEDLPELVHAARASLWEEQRPDPAETDPRGFARWVASRLSRARVVTCEGRVVFVAYADVQRAEGWLVQGVYTWPEARRRGFARQGMAFLLEEAFASGAAHVQLAVVAGNERATRLYQALGFDAFSELRTILFH